MKLTEMVEQLRASAADFTAQPLVLELEARDAEDSAPPALQVFLVLVETGDVVAHGAFENTKAAQLDCERISRLITRELGLQVSGLQGDAKVIPFPVDRVRYP